MQKWKWAWGGVLGVFGVFGGFARAQMPVWSDPEDPPVLAAGESTGFGQALAWWGSRLVIGAPRSHRNGERAGVLWNAPAWGGEKPVPWGGAPAPLPWQALGYSLAALPGSQLLAAGAPLAPGDGSDPGRVYLLAPGPTEMRLHRVLEGTDAHGGFGQVLAPAFGGLWVAAPFARDAAGAVRTGAVSGFFPADCDAERAIRLESPFPGQEAQFGAALACSGDWLAVAAPETLSGGAVCLYRRAAQQWNLHTILEAPRIDGRGFGSALAWQAGGTRLFVGAPRHGEGGVVFVCEFGAGHWRLAAEEHRAPVGLAGFGSSLAWGQAGLWVGAPRSLGGCGGLVWLLDPGTVPDLAWVIPGQAPREAFGASLLSRGDQCLAAAPGMGVADFLPAVRGWVAGFGEPAAGPMRVPSGEAQGRWIQPRGLGFRCCIWGLMPGQAGLLRVDGGPGALGAGLGGQADRHGHLWIEADQGLAQGDWTLTLRLAGSASRHYRVAVP
ncbi:MAG: hypothetical protein R3F33_15745 [Planctomycetota bacterium]